MVTMPPSATTATHATSGGAQGEGLSHIRPKCCPKLAHIIARGLACGGLPRLPETRGCEPGNTWGAPLPHFGSWPYILPLVAPGRKKGPQALLAQSCGYRAQWLARGGSYCAVAAAAPLRRAVAA